MLVLAVTLEIKTLCTISAINVTFVQTPYESSQIIIFWLIQNKLQQKLFLHFHRGQAFPYDILKVGWNRKLQKNVFFFMHGFQTLISLFINLLFYLTTLLF